MKFIFGKNKTCIYIYDVHLIISFIFVLQIKTSKKMADNKNKTPDQLKTIEESLTKAEMYVEDNKNNTMSVVLAIIVCFSAFFSYDASICSLKKIMPAQKFIWLKRNLNKINFRSS